LARAGLEKAEVPALILPRKLALKERDRRLLRLEWNALDRRSLAAAGVLALGSAFWTWVALGSPGVITALLLALVSWAMTGLVALDGLSRMFLEVRPRLFKLRPSPGEVTEEDLGPARLRKLLLTRSATGYGLSAELDSGQAQALVGGLRNPEQAAVLALELRRAFEYLPPASPRSAAVELALDPALTQALQGGAPTGARVESNEQALTVRWGALQPITVRADQGGVTVERRFGAPVHVDADALDDLRVEPEPGGASYRLVAAVRKGEVALVAGEADPAVLRFLERELRRVVRLGARALPRPAAG
jgi:hypothetical protein